MKISLAFLLFITCLSHGIFAQEQAPKLLHDAAQCLVAKAFLRPASLNLGSVIDTKSWPGEEVLYVVAYTSSGRSEGYVFTIFLTQQNHHQVFNIQNNAKFVRTKKVPDGVDFVEEALGVSGRMNTSCLPSSKSKCNRDLLSLRVN